MADLPKVLDFARRQRVRIIVPPGPQLVEQPPKQPSPDPTAHAAGPANVTKSLSP